MKLRNRVGVVVLTVTMGAAGTLGLAACGSTDGTTQALGADASALTSLGFSDDDVTASGDTTTVSATDAASPAASASPGGKGGGNKHRKLRRLTIRRSLARNVEHGLITVRTKDGDKTIEVQRGTVTAITATTVTVKSTDGFSLTWTFGTPIHVVEHRTAVQPTAVAVGATVGVAGLHTDSTDTASLLVIPNKK